MLCGHNPYTGTMTTYSESAVEKAEEVLQPAQKASLAWLWIVLLLALVVVGLIMIFGPK